jgi:hypothetical protein
VKRWWRFYRLYRRFGRLPTLRTHTFATTGTRRVLDLSMSRPSGIRTAFAAAVLLTSGCAFFARTPDTPARHVRFQDLNQLEGPGDRHYLLVFGSQTTPKLPRYTHTWVTFVHLAYFGDAASEHILRQLALRGAVPDPETTHDWLIPALGLDRHPITRREYTPPIFPDLPRFAPELP